VVGKRIGIADKKKKCWGMILCQLDKVKSFEIREHSGKVADKESTQKENGRITFLPSKKKNDSEDAGAADKVTSFEREGSPSKKVEA